MTDGIFPIRDFHALVQPLIGLAVALPWKGYGSAIFLELGQLSPRDPVRRRHELGEACITVEWDWRVECGATVLYGSSNSRPKIERGIGTLAETRIEAISLSGGVPELVVHFSNGQCLRSMAMVTGDPEWSIKLPGGTWVYARSGSLLVGKGTSVTTDEETAAFALVEETAKRWGVPLVEPARGLCAKCAWFVPIDGDGHLLDYGACLASTGPFDGRIVNCNSGCPSFKASEES